LPGDSGGEGLRGADNAKHRNLCSAELNNYIIIASNERSAYAPLALERDDRRYCVITGGHDCNLENEWWWPGYAAWREELPDLMLYLLSRPVSKDAARTPLVNAKKHELTDISEDIRAAYVREFMEQKRANANTVQDVALSQLCDEVNTKYNPAFKYTSRILKPILEELGYAVRARHNQYAAVVEPYPDEVRALDAEEEKAGLAAPANEPSTAGQAGGGDITPIPPQSPPDDGFRFDCIFSSLHLPQRVV